MNDLARSREPAGEDQTLEETLRRFDIALPEPVVARLNRYRRRLWDWNQKINLTRHTTLEKFVARDVVDSLRLAEHLPQGQRVLDVGSGGGVPGLVLAILRSDLKITCIDAVAKKARVLEDLVKDLGLPTRVLAARVQDHLAGGANQYDTLVARAVGRMTAVLEWLHPYWSHFSRLLLLKGPGWLDERGEARHEGALRTLQLNKLAEYHTPGTEAYNAILELRPKPGHEPPPPKPSAKRRRSPAPRGKRFSKVPDKSTGGVGPPVKKKKSAAGPRGRVSKHRPKGPPGPKGPKRPRPKRPHTKRPPRGT